MAATKRAAKPAAKKAAPKKSEPATVESVSLTIGDAHAVLGIDGGEYRLDGTAIQQLRRELDHAHAVLNPGL